MPRILLTEYYMHIIHVHTITSLSRVTSGQWCTHPLKSGWEFYPAEWYRRKTWEISWCWTVVCHVESERLCRLRKPDRMLRLKQTGLGQNQELHTLQGRDHCRESIITLTKDLIPACTYVYATSKATIKSILSMDNFMYTYLTHMSLLTVALDELPVLLIPAAASFWLL